MVGLHLPHLFPVDPNLHVNRDGERLSTNRKRDEHTLSDDFNSLIEDISTRLCQNRVVDLKKELDIISSHKLPMQIHDSKVDQIRDS